MRPVLIIGMIIIFISTLFIMLIFNTLVKANISCLGNPQNPKIVTCNMKRYNIDIIFGLMLIGFFIVLDVGALYLIFTGSTTL